MHSRHKSTTISNAISFIHVCLHNMVIMGVYVLRVTACIIYKCMGVIDCKIQVFGRIISCIDDVMRLDR